MAGSELRIPNRFITDHNEKGQAVFNTSVPEAIPSTVLPNTAKFFLGYTTSSFPTDLTNGSDVAAYASHLSTPPGLVIPGGTVLRIVDMPPAAESPMHRTVSIDYGVVLEGEVEILLDSGEKRTMKRGDICVQRGTNHQWNNTSKTEWARMLYVLQETKPIEVDGKKLGEDYGEGMGDVKPSGN